MSAARLHAEHCRLKILAAEEMMRHVNKTMVVCGLCATYKRVSTADIKTGVQIKIQPVFGPKADAWQAVRCC